MNTTRPVLCLCLLVSGAFCSLFGNTVEIADNRVNVFLGELIERAYIKNGSMYPSSWEELERLQKGAFSVNQFLPKGISVRDVYSFIRPEQRSLFPDGDLVLIRNKPLDWPSEWSNPKRVDLSDPRVRATMEGWMANNGSYSYNKQIRYLIYRGKDGQFLSGWWYEEDIQAMLSKTGLVIPPPRPGVSPSSAPAQVASANTLSRDVPAVKTEIERSVKAVEPPATTPASAQPTKTANSVWWIVGLIILAGGVVFIFQRKKPKD